MTPEQRQQLKSRLIQLCDELRAAIESNTEAGQTVELDQTRQGRLSRMDALQGQAMAKAALTRAAQQLKKAEFRLKHIDDPNLGLCEECDEVIPFARLLHNPTVDHCIACAESLEA